MVSDRKRALVSYRPRIQRVADVFVLARTLAGGVVTVVALRVLTEGTERLTVVSGRLTRPLGTGALREGVVNRDELPLGLV